MKFTLTLDGDKVALQAYLREHNWLTENETITSIENPAKGT
jgi:hypothetical protein